MADAADDLPEFHSRRALIVWYDDTTNTVELYDEEFSWLEVPELLRAAMDKAELNLPSTNYEEEETE